MERNLRKTRVGLVTSDKMDKTVVVEVESRTRHSLYGKITTSHKKYKIIIYHSKNFLHH